MSVREVLLALAGVIAERAEHDPEFSEKIRAALNVVQVIEPRTPAVQPEGEPKVTKRGSRVRRRTAPVLDPVAVARDGADALRARLAGLSLEQLKDIVAGHGMDPRKLVMKWKRPDKVIEHIVEMAISRAQQGDAFRWA